MPRFELVSDGREFGEDGPGYIPLPSASYLAAVSAAPFGTTSNNWVTCYVNSYSDLVAALPGGWVGQQIPYPWYTAAGYSVGQAIAAGQYVVPSSLANAGYYHYVFYGHGEGRSTACPVVDTTAPTISNHYVQFTRTSATDGQSLGLWAYCTVSDSDTASVTANGITMSKSGSTYSVQIGTYTGDGSGTDTSSGTVTFRATDNIGNQSTATASATFYNTPSVISISSVSWTQGSSYTFSGTTSSVNTTVTLSLSNGSGNEVRAYVSGGPTSSWVNASSSSASIPLTFTTSHANSTFGSSKALTINVQSRKSGTTTNHSASKSITLYNNYDNTDPAHGSKSWSSGSLSWSDTDNTSSKSITATFQVTETRATISSASVVLSGSTNGLSTSISSSGSSKSKTYTVTITGSTPSLGTNNSFSVGIRAYYNEWYNWQLQPKRQLSV